MTTEQKEAIDNLEKLSEYGLCYTINEKIIVDIETVLNLIQEKEEELKKKDKIIDELAKAFKQDDVRSVEEIKQFYERKVENDNSKE